MTERLELERWIAWIRLGGAAFALLEVGVFSTNPGGPNSRARHHSLKQMYGISASGRTTPPTRPYRIAPSTTTKIIAQRV